MDFAWSTEIPLYGRTCFIYLFFLFYFYLRSILLDASSLLFYVFSSLVFIPLFSPGPFHLYSGRTAHICSPQYWFNLKQHPFCFNLSFLYCVFSVLEIFLYLIHLPYHPTLFSFLCLEFLFLVYFMKDATFFWILQYHCYFILRRSPFSWPLCISPHSYLSLKRQNLSRVSVWIKRSCGLALRSPVSVHLSTFTL